MEGTPEDWKEIARRAVEFSRFDLEWWIEPLLPVLQQFTAAAEGNVDRQFWDSIYKWQGPDGSGSPHISGWVLNLFPYLHHSDDKWIRLLNGKALPLQRNPWLSLPPSRRGPGRDDFPSSPAKVPFLWQFRDAHFEMEFIGGLLGISQDSQSLRLRPEIGWAIREARPTDAEVQSLPA